jgi:hypothetical protein
MTITHSAISKLTSDIASEEDMLRELTLDLEERARSLVEVESRSRVVVPERWQKEYSALQVKFQ